jgi:hypothetical protein
VFPGIELNVESTDTIHQSELLCTQIAADEPDSVSVMDMVLFCVGMLTVAIGYDDPEAPDDGIVVDFALPL